MSFSNNSSVSTLSTNPSSERIYDFEYMMKLAASSASAMSSTSTLAQLNSDEDVAEIVKLSPLTSIQNSRNSQNSDSENEEYYYYGATDDNDNGSEDEDEDEYEEYGSWYEIRTDLSEDLLDELRDAVYDAINLKLPLSPVSEPVSLPLDLPAQAETKPALPARSLQTLVQQQQQQKYSAPIVQTLAPPIQFQSRAFATLDARRQSKPVQRQTHTVTVNALKASNAFNPNANAYNPSNAFNAFSWRRDVPRNSRNSYSNLRETTQTRNTFPIRSNVNVNAKANTVSSWRNTKPGTEWKYNEEAKGYTLITV